ncbi:RNA polymerase sigma factor [Marixanthomonas sp. SCSIO 43207]|uniref:RNA polymerase sigma factor n=1 Tax=Marixanthomonas sp. SCSIO 43207 TaxID=2779360 RepID=UPI001CA91F85|nr:RNA polymerase sigma factor [Marixanthomonas sp. SCSIO 43207]UAB80627.1 RNA polymerase sigma factor [Marixanthomonas sp. SCSIO 43207]
MQEQAFTTIIKDNEGILYKVTRLFTQTEADQQDLYQEIVINLWKGFGSFRGDAKVSTWMYRIALNTAVLYSKKEKRKGQKVSLDGITLVNEVYDPILEQQLKLVYKHIRELNDVEKGIIFLFLEGKKYETIASITGLSTSNVGTRMARIKEKLKNKITKK